MARTEISGTTFIAPTSPSRSARRPTTNGPAARPSRLFARVSVPKAVDRIDAGVRFATIAPADPDGMEDKKDGPEAQGFDQLRSLPLQHIRGDHTVRPDGTVYLGVYGSVPVAGYTLSQAAQAIREAAHGIVAATPQELPVMQAPPAAVAAQAPVGGTELPMVR